MTTQETLLKYVTDMHALENHILQPLKSQTKDNDFKAYPEAQTLIQRIASSTEASITTLESAAKSLDGDARSGFKSAVTAVAGAAAAVVNEARTHAMTKKLRDDYTALCLASVGYELLHTTGNALGSSEIARMALHRLHEIAGFIMELSDAIIPVAVQELSETNEVDTSSIATSQKNVREAWTP
jgi:ferritin-like metal-binding protein YciE